MSIKVFIFNTKEKELFEKARKIRTAVFVEEQKVSKEEEFDGLDDISIQYLIFDNGNAVCTGRRRITDEGHKLERFAVCKQYRGKQFGARLLEAMLNDILPSRKNIYLNSQVSAEKFYAKFGFEKTGKMFEEAGIEHFKMFYKT